MNSGNVAFATSCLPLRAYNLDHVGMLVTVLMSTVNTSYLHAANAVLTQTSKL